MRRVGLLGGSFDPPHLGHLTLANEAARELNLDLIRWIPAAISPHKLGQPISDAGHRMEMLGMMVDHNPSFVLDNRELNRPGPSFTVDTLQELRSEFPQDEFYLIMGEDSLRSLTSWKSPDVIRELAQIVVYRRMESGTGPLPPHDVLLQGIPITISSSEIRTRRLQADSIEDLVTPEVNAYIHSHALYLQG